MRGCVPTGIESLTTRRSPPRSIIRRNDILPCTRSAGLGVREEPGEAPAVCRRQRCDQRGRYQSSDIAIGTHSLFLSTRLRGKRGDPEYNDREGLRQLESRIEVTGCFGFNL
jgi:hypothetical protein